MTWVLFWTIFEDWDPSLAHVFFRDGRRIIQRSKWRWVSVILIAIQSFDCLSQQVRAWSEEPSHGWSLVEHSLPGPGIVLTVCWRLLHLSAMALLERVAANLWAVEACTTLSEWSPAQLYCHRSFILHCDGVCTEALFSSVFQALFVIKCLIFN